MGTLRASTIPREEDPGAPAGPERTPYLRRVYARGEGAVDVVSPVRGALVIGREPPDGGVALPADGWVSRQHARVTARDERLDVEDLQSRNGTFIDGERVSGVRSLAPGQTLRVGGAVFVCGVAALADDAELARAHPPPPGFVVRAPASAALWRRLVRVAASDVPAVIVGEIGSGKTAVAQLLHRLSKRASGPFVPHNASAIPPNLEDATLFGVTAGYIPGVQARAGLLVQADGGTLFLDELADLPAPAQAKLLDAFDPNTPSFLAVGAAKRQPTRCRLVVAVQRDLFELVASGRLRHDLASRLAVARLDVPPLRARREEIVALFAGALERAATRLSSAEVLREPELAEALLLARWTENVRGLESLAQRVALGETLTVPLVRAHAERGRVEAEAAEPAPGAATTATSSAAAAPLPVDTPTVPRPRRVWPPEPGEVLEQLAAHDFAVTPVAALYGRTRETLGRHLAKVFGAGGKDLVKRAYRVWHASGRAPLAGEVERAYALFSATAIDPAARARWVRGEALDE